LVDSEIVRINRVLALRLFEAEEQLRQVRARRREDGRANARTAEILAEHRSAWLDTERSLLNRLDDARRVELELRAQVESLERELSIAQLANSTVVPADNDTYGKEKRENESGEGEVEGEVSEEEVDEEEGMVLYEEGVEEGLELDKLAAMFYQQRLQMQLPPMPPMDSHGLGPEHNANFHCNDSNWFDLSNPSTKPIPNHILCQVIGSRPLVFCQVCYKKS
jgi:hypothetical protein